ncbi:MAG: galactitol-1-phosphate 5-dehydrogenase [Firmicutes bacterium]|nr:galactitol-1-phosphate 5-dehydrogenase [Bacillota bacterium]
MKALVLKDYKKFEVEDVPTPEIGPEDVLIRVKACSICGSDVHGMDGSTGRRIPPIIMGHEASGVIDKTGSNVRNFKPGDRVTFDSTIYCGKCYYCFNGKINLCDNRRVLGVSCSEYRQNGAFAEYVAVPQHILYRIPDTVSFERAAMVEPLSIALHALNRTSLKLNDNVVVVGAGMIGLLIIQLLINAGCGKVIAVDIDPDKLQFAEKFGAFAGIKADGGNVVEEIYNITKNRGVDVSFEVVGISSTLDIAVKCLKKGGLATIVGNLSPVVELPLQLVVTREITLNGSCASAGEYERCLDMIAGGAVDIDTFISAVAPLEEGAAWFKRLYDKEPGLMKVILKP